MMSLRAIVGQRGPPLHHRREQRAHGLGRVLEVALDLEVVPVAGGVAAASQRAGCARTPAPPAGLRRVRRWQRARDREARDANGPNGPSDPNDKVPARPDHG